MSKSFIRKWEDMDASEVTKHLLILGALTCDCASCRELGIDYTKNSKCPKCGTEFKYITFRRKEMDSHSRYSIVNKIRTNRPELIIIDYLDYKDQSGKYKAKDLLFKDMPKEQKEEGGFKL